MCATPADNTDNIQADNDDTVDDAAVDDDDDELLAMYNEEGDTSGQTEAQKIKSQKVKAKALQVCYPHVRLCLCDLARCRSQILWMVLVPRLWACVFSTRDKPALWDECLLLADTDSGLNPTLHGLGTCAPREM